MALTIEYQSSCSECEGTMTTSILDLSQNPGNKVTIDLDLFGDMDLRCQQCGHQSFVPAISDYIESI